MVIWRHYAPLVFLNARVLCNRIRALTGNASRNSSPAVDDAAIWVRREWHGAQVLISKSVVRGVLRLLLPVSSSITHAASRRS